jgi:hypothetical protein
MKPLNLDNRPCSPISSNCVVWQGPTLDCIELCNGDTISDVVAKMAEELCTILDQIDVTNYDLTCLGITACGPKDFNALIQLLIDKICDSNGITPGTTRTESACPGLDCIVSVAPCFVQNGQTTMSVIDYVQMIATKICNLIDQIGDLQEQINNLNIRVTVLEEATPPSFTVPSLTVDCDLGTSSNGIPVNPSASRPIDVILDALINDNSRGYCIYTATLGPVSELLTAISRKCILDSTDRLSGSGTYGSISGWVPDASYDTVADAINNIWLVLCDIFSYVGSVSINVEDTNSIDLTVTGGVISANIVDTGWVDLLGFGFMGGNKPECRRIGNQIHFRGTVVVPLPNPVAPTTVASYTSTSYNSITTAQVFTGGTDGCLINTNGSITFNNNNSVIPTSVLDTGTNLDGTYVKPSIIGTRQINLDPTSYGTALSGVFNIGVFSDKRLYIGVLKDLEYTSTVQNPAQLGSSHLRYITSNVRAGEKVPNFLSNNTTIHNDPSTGVQALNVDFNTFEYPFDCNAGLETEIGGFAVRLDGLIAYVDPCTTDIKSYICKGGPA